MLTGGRETRKQTHSVIRKGKLQTKKLGPYSVEKVSSYTTQLDEDGMNSIVSTDWLSFATREEEQMTHGDNNDIH